MLFITVKMISLQSQVRISFFFWKTHFSICCVCSDILMLRLLHWMLKRKATTKQVRIPVGCVPPALMAAFRCQSWRGCVFPPEGRHPLEGVTPSGGRPLNGDRLWRETPLERDPSGERPPELTWNQTARQEVTSYSPLWTEWHTGVKNITFPPLRWQR